MRRIGRMSWIALAGTTLLSILLLNGVLTRPGVAAAAGSDRRVVGANPALDGPRQTGRQGGARRIIRKAFRMSVNAGQEAEYERRHSPIWPELEAVLLQHGVRSYSIFLDPQTRDLFAYVEIEDEQQWDAVASTDVCKRWWQSMRTLMPSNPDNSPVSSPLRQVFHLEAAR